jgi:hypothetical protein
MFKLDHFINDCILNSTAFGVALKKSKFTQLLFYEISSRGYIYDATTILIMTLLIITLLTMTVLIMTLLIMTLLIMTLLIMTYL